MYGTAYIPTYYTVLRTPELDKNIEANQHELGSLVELAANLQQHRAEKMAMLCEKEEMQREEQNVIAI